MSQDNTPRTGRSAAEAFNATSQADVGRLAAARRAGRALREKREDGTAPRERENSFGGLSLQLHVSGEIPGYKLIWENDENGAIETRLQQGFDFVTQDELYAKQAKIVPDEEITSAISRYTKDTRNDGQALRAYLLKVPEDVWTEIEADRYRAADNWDQSIRQQVEEPDQKQGMRSLKHLRSSVDTGYRKEVELGQNKPR